MPGKPPYVAPPKTPSPYPTVPLPQVVVDALADHLAEFPAVEVEILDTTVKPEPKPRMATLVFSDVERQGGTAAPRPQVGGETLDTYSHLWPDSEDRTREAVDAVLARAAGTAAEVAR
jgi:hypothetical protein